MVGGAIESLGQHAKYLHRYQNKVWDNSTTAETKQNYDTYVGITEYASEIS